MKCALMLWKDRVITVSAVQEAHGAGCLIKLKAKENRSTGKKTTAYAAFSSTHWKDDTNTFLKSVMTLSTTDMDAITDLVKLAAKKVMRMEEKGSALTINDDDDNDIVLCNSSGSSESSVHENGVSAAQILRWKRHGMFSYFLPCYMVSNVGFKSPKQQEWQPPLTHTKSKFVIKTWVKTIILMSGTITPHALGVLKLTLRCTTVSTTLTLTPQCVIKAAVQGCTILLVMANLSLYDAMKNTLTPEVRSKALILRWMLFLLQRTLPLSPHHLCIPFQYF